MLLPEHFTLVRYVYEPKPATQKGRWERVCRKFQKSDKLLERAERNENILPTKLYDPIWTPHNQLGDWGIGWGLYFASIRALMLLCLLSGLLSIPNMLFFKGPDYDSLGQGSASSQLACLNPKSSLASDQYLLSLSTRPVRFTRIFTCLSCLYRYNMGTMSTMRGINKRTIASG
jgi:hypothetical protein